MGNCKTISTYVRLVVVAFILGYLLADPLPTGAALVARNGSVLHVLVPLKEDYLEFVDCSDNSNVKGFCIDVFSYALSILTPRPDWTDVEYHCYEIGDQSYSMMIDLLADDERYDAVVGDTTVSAARMATTSFTQTFLDSGIVIVAPDENSPQSFPGVLFEPFTGETWAITLASFFLTAVFVWWLERNEQRFLGGEQTSVDIFKAKIWLVTAILFLLRRDLIKNGLTKFVLAAWMILLLLLSSSYTASLSALLTSNRLSQKALTIDDLAAMNATVGYQVGSVVKDYLETRHHITNLVPLYNATQYADALHSKDVVAVVDEIPYISLFLAAQSASSCTFSVSAKLTIEGWGFAFYDKAIASAFTVAILNLSESGQIKRLQDGWKLSNFQCPSVIQSTELNFRNSQTLFVFFGGAMFLFLAVSLIWACFRNKLERRFFVKFQANGRHVELESQERSYHGLFRTLSARNILSRSELIRRTSFGRYSFPLRRTVSARHDHSPSH